MEPQNVSCYFFGETHPTILPLAGGIIGGSEGFHFAGYLAIPPRPILYPLYCVRHRLDALKLEITLLDYLVTSTQDHNPAYELNNQGKEVPIYIDDNADKGNKYKTLAYSADYPMGYVPVSASASCFQSAPFSPPGSYSSPGSFSSPEYNYSLAQFSDLFSATANLSASPEIEFAQEMADNTLAMVEPLTSSHEQPSVVPGVYLSAPQSPVGSSVNLRSPMDSAPESWIMSSAMDASSIQVDDDGAPQPVAPETAVHADTLHTILQDYPLWRDTLVCLRLKMKVEVCCGGAQNPFLLTQPSYTDQRIQFFEMLFEQSLIAVGIDRKDLEQEQAAKWLTGFTSEAKRVAKLAIMDTRPAFGFGLHDTVAADPSLLANKCVGFLRRFMTPQSALLPISANSLKWLLEHEIIKSLIYYFIYRASTTSSRRVVISNEEPAIFLTAQLPPMEMWYSALLARLIELIKAMRTLGLPVNIMMATFPPASTIYAEVLACLLHLLAQTNDPAYPDLLEVLASMCNINSGLFSASASFAPSTRHFLAIEHTEHTLKYWLQTQGHEIVPDPLFATTSVLFGWVDPLDLIAVLQVSLRVAAIERQLLKEQNTIFTFLVRGGQSLMEERMYRAQLEVLLFSKAIANLCEELKTRCCPSWLATSWQFEVDFPQAHEVPELYEHLSRHNNDFLSPLMQAWFGRVTYRTYITTSSADSKSIRIDNTESFKAKKNKMPDALKSDFSILELKKQRAQAEVDMFSEVIARTAGIQYSDDGTFTSHGTAGTFESCLPANSSKWFDYWFEDWCSTSNISHVDRLFHAANDFWVNRTWPPVTSGVGHLWDQFRLYVGLLVNPAVYHKPTKDEADDDNDNDCDSPSNTQINGEDTFGLAPSLKDPASSTYSVELDDQDDDEGLQARKSDLEEQREEKLHLLATEQQVSFSASILADNQGVLRFVEYALQTSIHATDTIGDRYTWKLPLDSHISFLG
ncbi:uncharacterized protein F5891DRAFT_1194593 [Suillus fuscotomentosus]|uniref:Uncharacterized protein n=1 Tax=Suillus fuscotomentosus TaxID=1912939 RepID=A0AAD4DWZ0_9AGAM|nr:uncharacterized protein F5891DRAFT_1194593 [Suillus fuscotomentosus]KAG1895081.1 hypothetical protein F5891DRAFT_1194593 [Suillus fuscotomentosus]